MSKSSFDPVPLPVTVTATATARARIGKGLGLGRGLGTGIGVKEYLFKWMGFRNTSAPLETPTPLSACPTPPLGIERPPPPLGIECPHSPLGIECHFKPLRSLFTTITAAHFDRMFPTAVHLPSRTLNIAHMYKKIKDQNAIFDLNDKCENCEKCDISCLIL